MNTPEKHGVRNETDDEHLSGGQEVAGSNPVSPTILMTILGPVRCKRGSHQPNNREIVAVASD